MNSQNHPLPVLIVDDDPVTRTLLEAQLEDAGHPVLVACDGAEAMSLLHEHKPRIVILDWVMPQMDGLQLCRAIRKVHNSRFVYIIMLTVHSETEQLIRAFNAGVNDFLSKPFNAGEMLARLRAGMRVIHLEAALEKKVKLARRLNSRLSQLNAELRHTAATDELTGMINRREAIVRLHDLWAIAQRYRHPLSCALIDVDGFKQINDHQGHLAGDAVLREVATVLSGAVRECDIVSRFGGDEFLIVLPHTDAAGAHHTIERCREAICRHVFRSKIGTGGADKANPSSSTLTISAGVAEATPRISSVDLLLHEADQALYSAKRHGKNAVRLSA
jgi:diguanylate cyclase (GGDEF)-like protein